MAPKISSEAGVVQNHGESAAPRNGLIFPTIIGKSHEGPSAERGKFGFYNLPSLTEDKEQILNPEEAAVSPSYPRVNGKDRLEYTRDFAPRFPLYLIVSRGFRFGADNRNCTCLLGDFGKLPVALLSTTLRFPNSCMPFPCIRESIKIKKGIKGKPAGFNVHLTGANGFYDSLKPRIGNKTDRNFRFRLTMPSLIACCPSRRIAWNGVPKPCARKRTVRNRRDFFSFLNLFFLFVHYLCRFLFRICCICARVFSFCFGSARLLNSKIFMAIVFLGSLSCPPRV